ncbi:MAG: rod shape-determining protein MreD [Cognatishimia sp.]|uniref:rod shape-determining protein MreD n=1 Tax=Cognatishimia sp. TaxID=2211648 RepID=UPI003B8C3E02
MAETSTAKPWILRASFAALALSILYWQLLPLNTVPSNWTGPDFLLVLTMVWVLRRPDYVPVLLIAALMLLADFLLSRPPGLLAALTVIVTENLRKRTLNGIDITFSVEWLTAAAGLTAIVIGNRVLVSIFVLDQASLGLTLIQLLVSILAYPLVVGCSAPFLGLRKIRFREGEAT